MKPNIEINRLSLVIDKTQLPIHQSTIVLIEGDLPLLKIPFKIGLVDMDWEVGSENKMPDNINLVIVAELADPDWKVHTKMNIFLDIGWHEQLNQGDGSPPLTVKTVHLAEDSQFYVNSHEVILTPTVNRILSGKKEILESMVRGQLIEGVKNISHHLFGSEMILDLVTGLFYQLSGEFFTDRGKILLSAAYDREHFRHTDEAPPYLFLKIPTVDLEYFMNHFNWPPIEIKGYELILKSMKVAGHNKLIINLNEINRNWDVALSLILELRDNTIYPVVEKIEASGLGLLKQTLFNILKGLLIREIEKNPVSVVHIYQGFRDGFEKKYSFMQIQPGYIPVMDALAVDEEKTEIMVHFIDENPELVS